MSTFKKLLGLGGEDDKTQSSNRQSTSAVSAEHSGSLSSAAQKASNLVPATIAERDETQKDVTVCQQESQVITHCEDRMLCPLVSGVATRPTRKATVSKSRCLCSWPASIFDFEHAVPATLFCTCFHMLLNVTQKSKGTWEAAKEATAEAEKQGAEAHLKSCEAEHLLQSASELTQTAANARAREEEVSLIWL